MGASCANAVDAANKNPKTKKRIGEYRTGVQ